MEGGPTLRSLRLKKCVLQIVSYVRESDVQKFVEYVRFKIEDTVESNAPPEPTLDLPDQIRKLAELKDQGILTEEEFESKKKELLAKM